MRIRVVCPQKLAMESHRQHNEEVQVDVNDNIEDVKVKTTMIYTNLDPAYFYFKWNGRKLQSNQTILNLQKQNPDNGQLSFDIVEGAGCCCQII